MADRSVAEEWRPVVGYEGYYEVSSLGRVRSVDRVVTRRSGPGAMKTWRLSGVLMSLTTNGRTGYLGVRLTRDGQSRVTKVHQVVATAFIGPRPLGHEINHIDGDKSNNAPSNLEYVSHKANMEHAATNGLMPKVHGVKNPRARLSEREVLDIRERFCHGESHRALASEYGVGATTVWHIVTGKNWPHIGGPLLHDRVGGRKLRTR